MHPRLAVIRDGALDRAVAEPEDARSHLAFAGAVDAVEGDSGRLPLPILVSMAAVSAVERAAASDGAIECLIDGAALLVARRDVSVATAASMAQLPASTVREAVENRRDCSSN